MSGLLPIVDDIYAKVEALLRTNAEMASQRDSQEQTIALLQRTIEQQKNTIDKLTQENNNLKQRNTPTPTGNPASIENRIDQLIDAVDRSISLLSSNH